MRRLRLLLFGLLATAPLALAQSFYDYQRKTFPSLGVDAGTVTCADLGASDGVPLRDVAGFSVTVSGPAVYDAGTGAHVLLTGAGNLRCCTRQIVSPDGGARWMRCPSFLDVPVTSSARDQTSGDFEALVGDGRLMYVPEYVGVTDGGIVDLTLQFRRKP